MLKTIVSVALCLTAATALAGRPGLPHDTLDLVPKGTSLVAPATNQNAWGTAMSVYAGHKLECIAKPSGEKFVNAHAFNPKRHADGTVTENVVCVNKDKLWRVSRPEAPSTDAVPVGTLVYVPDLSGKANHYLGRVKSVSGGMVTVGNPDCKDAPHFADITVTVDKLRLPWAPPVCQ